MLVIYDLDKTSLFCPIADFMDRFIPNNKFLKQIYYLLYPFAHILEIKLGLLQINRSMYLRALSYDQTYKDVRQIILTARHKSFSTEIHKKLIFRDLDIPIFCIAQGITNLSKAAFAKLLPIDKNEEVIMYDDNIDELNKMRNTIGPKFTGLNILFKDNHEENIQIVN